jgi:tetratricopeptide (TPR) repeat protein
VIVLADSIDQNCHVIYDDTAALGRAIRSLDNPFGRLLMPNTLGKAYYYMGRNLSFANEIADAAECYIKADRLQIDDPIYRGRVNSCMGYICAQNRSDSLALILYERSNDDFQESCNDWYYAQSILNLVQCRVDLQQYSIADSLLYLAQSYQLDSAYHAHCYEICGLYFYAQQQYDSALVYLKQGLNYWQSESEKSFTYLKIMQVYYDLNQLHLAIPYAKLIVEYSTNPNHLSNAYYCLMQDAKNKNNTELLSQFSHARTDAQQELREYMLQDAEALPILEEYLRNPHPWRWVKIALFSFVTLCIILIISIITYRKRAVARMNVSDEQIMSLSTQIQEQQDELQKQSKLHHYDKRLKSIRRKYPKPLNKWNDYANLKKDIQPYLKDLFLALDKLDLTNRDKVFCVLSFIYPQMATEDLANYLCITKEALMVRKNRIAKKLEISSAKLGDFLQNLCQ